MNWTAYGVFLSLSLSLGRALFPRQIEAQPSSVTINHDRDVWPAIHRDVFIPLVINYESRGLSSRNAFVARCEAASSLFRGARKDGPVQQNARQAGTKG